MATRSQIARTADLAIQKYRAKGIDQLLAVEVSIRPAWRSLAPTNSSYPCDLQIFGQPEELVHVTLEDKELVVWRREKPLTVDDLMRSVNHLPNPLDEPDVPTDMKQRRGWRLLQQWWRINGKCFELLKLPAEIRDMVYAQLFGHEITPYPTRKSKRYANALYSIECSTRLALARACQQVHREVMSHISLYNDFGFQRCSTLRATLKTHWLAVNMRRVSLRLAMATYIDIFGMATGEEDDYKPMTIAKAFRTLELRQLSVIMPDCENDIPIWAADFCLDCLIRFIFRALEPFIYGHPCTIQSTVVDLTAEQAGLSEGRRKYEAWKTKAIEHGLRDTGLDAWDEWIAGFESESDGGSPVANE